MLKRLAKAFPDLTATTTRDGVWARVENPPKEMSVQLNAGGVDVRFPLYGLPDPGGDTCIQVADFDPADAMSVVVASTSVADALSFHVEITTRPSWGIEVRAIRDQTPKQAAVSQSYEGSPQLHRQPLASWAAACGEAAEAWCQDAETLRPSSKKKMLKNYGGPKGVTETLLRDLAAFGKLTTWYEVRTGASHENTALLHMPPWSVAVRFSGIRNGKLRLS